MLKAVKKWLGIEQEIPELGKNVKPQQFTGKHQVKLQICADNVPVREIWVSISANSNAHAITRANAKISIKAVDSRKVKYPKI
jgi:hypothetical protein